MYTTNNIRHKLIYRPSLHHFVVDGISTGIVNKINCPIIQQGFFTQQQRNTNRGDCQLPSQKPTLNPLFYYPSFINFQLKNL